MKFLVFHRWLTFIAITVLLAGCDVLGSADDVTFDVEVPASWQVSVSQDGENVGYAHEDVVRLSNNAELAKYLDKLKHVRIDSITYRINGYDASPHNTDVIFVDGHASFGPADGSQPTVSVQFAAGANELNLKNATAETRLNIDAEGLAQIGTLFREQKELRYRVSGTLSKVPVQFQVQTRFYLTVTASALD